MYSAKKALVSAEKALFRKLCLFDMWNEYNRAVVTYNQVAAMLTVSTIVYCCVILSQGAW